MKRVLSLVLALVLVLGMIPTFAADMTAGQHLYEHEFIAGVGAGDLDEAGMLTREQLAKLILELNGKKEEAEALTLPPSYTDSAKISAWARPYVAYAQIEGLMVGFTDGSFRPQTGVSGQQLAQVLTRALGYEFSWATVVAEAADLGIEVATGAALTRGEAFEAMWVTVNTVPNGEELPLGVLLGKLEDTTPPPVGPLAVVSATAINTKQVEVVFNQAVDKVTAGDEDNYTFAGNAAGKAVVQEDGMTVLVTMAGETKITNAGTIAFKVLKAVKDANGVALAADYSVTALAAVDTTVPSVTNIEAVGAKTLKITFSEPVYDAAGNTTLENDQITVKSGIYTYVVTNAVADYAARTITITVGTNLIEGDLTVKINAPGMSDAEAIRDFAGLVLIPVEKTYTFVKDTTVATATLTSVNKATKVAKVTFSKPVYGTDVVLYHSVNGVAAYGTATVSKAEGVAATEWEFTFTNALPSGTLTFYLVNSTVAANQLTDLYGVKVPNQMFTYEVVADTTAPTVSTVTVNTNVSIDIKFSEAVDAAQVVAANFEILKPDGTKLAFTPSVQAVDTVRLTATLVDNTTYTITVKAMKDVAGNAMAAAYTVQKLVADNENPDVDDAYVVGNDKIYITFTEAMNEAQMLNKANYTVNAAALESDDTITLVSAKKIVITIADDDLAGDGSDDVVIGAITDLAGKKLDNDAAFSTAVSNIPAATLTFTAKATAANKIKMTFDKVLGSFDAAEFSIRQQDNGAAVPAYAFLAIESNTVNADGVSEVVLVLDKNLKANAKDTTGDEALEVLVTLNGNTKSTEGVALTNAAQVNITDSIVPTVDKIVFVNATTIEVQFTEALESDFFASSLTAKNGFSISGGTLTSALPQGADSNVVVLTGTSFTINTDVNYNGTNGIQDMNTNSVAAFAITDALTAVAFTNVEAGTPDETFTVTVSNSDPVFTANNADIIAAASTAVNAVTIGDWTFTLTPATGVTVDAADVFNVAIDANGVVTVSVTDANASLNGDHTLTVTHVSGTTDTVNVNLAAAVETITE